MSSTKHARAFVLVGSVAMTCAAVSACGKKKSSSDSSSSGGGIAGVGGAAASAAVNLKFISAGSAGSAASLDLTDPVVHTGQTGLGELLSLKYFITSISICQDATLTGSGFSGQSGCLDLYDNPDNSQTLYNTMDQAEAAKPAHDADFKDLMQGLTFTGTISEANVGTYKYAFVNWMKPIKVTAQVKIDDDAGTTLYTHAGNYANSTDHNGFVHNQTLVQNMATGPATEAITMLPNGGSVFTFGKPFSITSEDLSANTQYSMDMVFNPEGLVKAADSGTAQSSIFAADANGNLTGPSMAVPFLSLIPLVHKASDAVVKETYLVHFVPGMSGAAITPGAPITATTDPFDIRLELYYLKGAATITSGAAIKSDLSEDIYGAHADMLYVNNGTSKTLNPPSGVPNIVSFAQDAATGQYSFYSWQGTTAPAFMSGFKRLGNVGDKGSATVTCGASGVVLTTAGCYDATANKYYAVSFTPAYELVGRHDVISLIKSTLTTIIPFSLGITYAPTVTLAANSCMAFTVAPIKPGTKTGIDATNETAIPAPVAISVSLSASAAAVYSDAACTKPATSVAIAAGGSGATFYAQASAAGAVTVTATSNDAVANDSLKLAVK